MCGISGIYSRKKSLDSLSFGAVEAMNSFLKHRGPDFNQVTRTSNSCILGHVRLSIIDVTDASNQPMISRCGRYSIVFNGEIYNYKEIKKELGLKTISNGDTEVLLEALAMVGLSVLPKINGIFAFALYDNVLNELTIARDRFGVKPLYFTCHDENLLFASEIKALTSSAGVKKSFNANAISDFLTFLCIPEEKTFYQDIFKLKPGEVKTFKENGEVISNIFALPIREDKINFNIDPQFVQNQFSQSVKRQSISDVPIGLFLSGGVDSNGILHSLLEHNIKPKSYTAYFESDHKSYTSELSLVQKVTQDNELKLSETNIGRDSFWNVIDKIIFHQDEPLADPVSIPVFFLSEQVAKEGLKVVHVGEGADEIFFGYEAWRVLERLQHLQYLQAAIRRVKLDYVLRPFLVLRQLLPTRYKEAWRRFLLGLPLFWGGTDALTYDEKLKIGVKRELLQKTDIFMLKSYEKFKNTFLDTAPNKWMSYFDLKLRLPELMLMRVDKMTMAHGVEARVPFLDNAFATLAWNVEIKKKRQKVGMKYIFKQALSGIVDNEVLLAAKKGFNAPAEEWCVESKENVLAEIKQFCSVTNCLKFDAVEALCTAKPRHLWRFYILARWHHLTFGSE